MQRTRNLITLSSKRHPNGKPKRSSAYSLTAQVNLASEAVMLHSHNVHFTVLADISIDGNLASNGNEKLQE